MINFESIKPSSVGAVLICVGLFFNIELMIYILKPSIFLNFDFLRLSAIGLGLTFPILTAGILSTAIIRRNEKKDDDKEWLEKQTWASGAAIAIIIVSLTCLISHHYGYSLTRAMWIIFWVNFGLLFLGIAFSPKKRRPHA